MKIVVFKKLWVNAITLFPFIIVRDKYFDPQLLNHESIHLRQQKEMLILPFYIWYVWEYLIRLIKYKNHYKAYRNISFEQEAYNNEDNLTYLDTRKPFSWFKLMIR